MVSFSPAGDVETNPGPDNANMNWKEKVSAKYYSQEELFSMPKNFTAKPKGIDMQSIFWIFSLQMRSGKIEIRC